MIDRENIPKNWTITSLGEVADYLNGRAFKPTEWEQNGLPIIRIQNLNSERIKFNYSTKIFEDRYKVVKGDLLFAWAASLGVFIWDKKEAWLNQHIFKVVPKSFCVKKFLFYALERIIAELYSKTHGSGMVHITKGKFESTEILLPPLPEQHRIVSKIEELFTDLDKGIEQLQTAQQQLKVYRQAVLKWAFEGKLTNEKNIRWGTLKEVIDGVEYGSAAKSNTEGKIPVLRMGNIQNGKFEWDDLVYTSDDEEIKKYFLKKDDVLFNRTNSPEWVGKTAIYKGEQPAIFAGYLIRINRRNDLLDANYLTHFLNSQTAKNHGNKVKSFGVNQSNINGTKLKAYPFPITSLKSQKKIVFEIESRLSVCDKIEETIETALKQSEILRYSILKKAFEGKLVKQNPKDEPAQKLLERIRAEKNKLNGKPEKEVKTKKKKKELA